jgi:autotransporter-associated beta strand protein
MQLATALLATASLPLGAFAAGETVTIESIAGGGIYPFFSNDSGTATNGYTIRVGAFTSASQASVEALGYNLLWVNNQFTLFGSGTTETLFDQAGSFDPLPNLTNTNDALKGEQAWIVYSNSATLTSSTLYGVATSSDASWVIPSAGPTWDTTITTDQLTTAAFGSYTGATGTDSVRVAATPTTALYWDSNGGAGRGGSGTWSSNVADTEWTTNSGGVAGDGTYAWGTTSGTDYHAGAGLTANFGGDAGTVTVSGTVITEHGITIEAAYTLTGGTISLAGANATTNTLEVTGANSATIASTLAGTNGFTKTGTGNLTLSGSNTVSGTVAVNAGKLQAAAASSLGSATTVIVNTGGSLLVSASEAVGNSTTVTLAGGTLGLSGSGITEHVGALTLSASSVLDLGALSGAGAVYFDNSSSEVWTGTLSIWNWNGTNMYGTSYGAGDRQIFFGTNASGLTSNQLDQISFYSDSGNSFIGTGFIRPTGEIAAVPEPETLATAAALLLLAAFTLKKTYGKNPSPKNPLQAGAGC